MELQTTKMFTIDGNSYQAKFPTERGLTQIEINKLNLSGGNYGSLIHNYTKASVRQATIIDMDATFKVVMPDIYNDIPELEGDKEKSLMDCNPFVTNNYIKFYTEEFFPWYNGLLIELFKDEESEENVDSKKK